MLKRFIACFVCVSIAATNSVPAHVYAHEQVPASVISEAGLLEKYPDARIIRVSPDEYPAFERKLRKRGYRQAETLNIQMALEDTRAEYRESAQTPANAKTANDCAGEGVDSSGEQSINVLLDITDDMMDAGQRSSGDAAAVVFIIIGTVVVIVWTLYVFKYLYDVSFGLVPCGRWHEFTAVSSSASTSGNQHARFNGLRYSTGFRDGAAYVGIGLEIGRADILLEEAGLLELKGNYFMMGPMLRWRLSRGINPAAFQLDFTAGTTEHDEIGLLAKARMSLLFGIGDNLRLGLSWGVLNINLDEDQGVITERSQYHYLYGISMGFRF